MSKPYRLVVFDWEGTLGDTLGHILHAMANVAKRRQWGELDERVARQYVTLGLVVVVRKLFPHLSSSEHEQLLQESQQELVTTPMNTCLLPGAKAIVEQLYHAGVMLAIATNKGYHSLQRTLQATGLDVFITTVRTAGQVPAKPCPQMLEEILDECGVLASEALMVGDSLVDIEMANQLGVDAVGVDFYHQQQAASLLAAGAKSVIDDYRQLADLLQLSEQEE